jgi:hypothetical protein
MQTDMTRAEQKALEAFPVSSSSTADVLTMDGNYWPRMNFIQGYVQAEKDLADAFQAKYAKELARADLALTWTDMKRVVHTYYVMQYEALSGELDVKFESDEFYKELLKRFNENKI